MSRLQDISKMNLADLDRPGQTALEEDSMLEESTTPEGNADIDETGPEGPSAEESEEAASPVGKESGTTAEKQENDSRKEEPKKMMEPSGEHYYVDVDIEESDLVSLMIIPAFWAFSDGTKNFVRRMTSIITSEFIKRTGR